MTVCLVMCAGGRAAEPVRAIDSAMPLIDSYVVVDTGITPEVRELVESALRGIEGELIDHPFEGSGPSFNRALARARGKADWLLHMHSDEVAYVFPTMREWLDGNHSPQTDAFQLPIINPGLVHRLPRLLRGDQEWLYVGEAHEYLDVGARSTRWLKGLDLHHFGLSDPSKFEFVIEALREGRAAGEPRATFYTAEALRDLGRIDEAIEVYQERMAQGGWEEERWYANYQCAKLSGDVSALLVVWSLRPHRHEPLQAAARIVAERGTADVLFVEDVG